MKLRLQGNSVRLRLSQSEVARLTETGRIEERIEFPGATLVYALESAAAPEPQASFEAGVLRIQLPLAAARTWAESHQVGISSEQKFDGTTISILVEKDFKCMHRAGDTDAFPNPDEEPAFT